MDEERIQHDNRIKSLIPANRETFMKLFEIKDDDVDYYKEELRVLLHMVYPDITWDKDTTEVILKNNIIKGQNILSLFSEFMKVEDWLSYTMGPYTESELVIYLVERFLC